MGKYFNQCLVCHHQKFIPVYHNQWKDSQFVKCKKCGLVFQNPQEDKKETVERYNKDYFEYELTNQHNFFMLIKKTLDDFNLLKLLKPGSQILEIGSATGLFLKYMNEMGHQSTGIEICQQSVQYGIKEYGVNLLNTTLEEASLTDSSYDFIHFSHLIEHLNQPKNFLEKIYSLLKKDGLVMITTPNASGLFSRYYHESWRCIVDDHLFIFNKNNLKQLCVNQGFKIIKSETWGSIPSGKAHPFIKRAADWFVKKSGLGDVVCYLCQK